MTHRQKKSLKIFLSAFVLFFNLVCLPLLLPSPVRAAEPIKLKLNVAIPGLPEEITIPDSTQVIADYIKAIYKYGIGIVGILATIVMMIGGVLWLTAGGNAGQVSEAKAWIMASASGLLVLAFSFIILATINTALVNFKITDINTIGKAPFDYLKLTEQAKIKSGRQNGGCCQINRFCNWVSAESDCSSGTFNKGKSCFELPTCLNPTCDPKHDGKDCPEAKNFCRNGVCIATGGNTNLYTCLKTDGRQDGDMCYIDNYENIVSGYCFSEQCNRKKNDGEDCKEPYECVNGECNPLNTNIFASNKCGSPQ